MDPNIDMGRAAINVAGQALVPTIVAHREGLLDRELYDAPRSGDPFVPEDAAPEATGPQATGPQATGSTGSGTEPHAEDAPAAAAR